MRKYLRHHWWWVTPIVVAMTLNAGLWYALKDSGPVRERFAADQASLSAPFVPTVIAEPGEEEVGKYDHTPAAAFVKELAQLDVDEILPAKQFTALSPNPGGPVTAIPKCFTVPEGYPSFTATPSGAKLPGITFTVLTTPTGAGAETVDEWQKAIWNCANVSRSYGMNVLPANTAGGFIASSYFPGSNNSLTHAVWARGDVVLAVTGPAKIDTKKWAQITHALDRAVTTKLTPICEDLNPTISDATRNPNHPRYRVPTRPKVVKWEAALALPEPVQHRSAGPNPELDLPEPQPQPDLAPVAPFNPREAETVVQDAPRGPAPELIDVRDIPSPRYVPEPGEAPDAPPAPEDEFTYQEPVADPSGPGCGWEFLDTTPPDVSEKKLKQLQDAAKQKAYSRAHRERGHAWIAHLAWVKEWEVWAEKVELHSQYLNLLERIEEANESWTEAEELRDIAAADYETAYRQYWKNQDRPTPEPQRPSPAPDTGITPPALEPPVVPEPGLPDGEDNGPGEPPSAPEGGPLFKE